MKAKEKLVRNFTSSKFQILLLVVLVLTVGFFWALATKQGWEIVVGIGGLMVTCAGYYFKKKTDQNIGLAPPPPAGDAGFNKEP